MKMISILMAGAFIAATSMAVSANPGGQMTLTTKSSQASVSGGIGGITSGSGGSLVVTGSGMDLKAIAGTTKNGSFANLTEKGYSGTTTLGNGAGGSSYEGSGGATANKSNISVTAPAGCGPNGGIPVISAGLYQTSVGGEIGGITSGSEGSLAMTGSGMNLKAIAGTTGNGSFANLTENGYGGTATFGNGSGYSGYSGGGDATALGGSAPFSQIPH